MFTKNQIIAFATVAAASLSVSAAPTYGYGSSSLEIAAVEANRAKEPNHPANASGNKATVHDGFHKNGAGATHATVKYSKANGDHVTTLHIGKDGSRVSGNQGSPKHAAGTSAPPNSPARRSLEARAFGNKKFVTPTAGSSRASKIKQSHQIAAVEANRAKEPNHPANASGNKATVHDGFHKNGAGATHATVKYSKANGDHVTTLHIAKDGSRVSGNQGSPKHAAGTSAPAEHPQARVR
ncbi:hypothetical protein NLJ89_g8937 [Agrocybe chaxingu]|uniref:Uncharacterized protein n=1 Tax=Agrocybe chaxingu TaxID=84603 RepID=A0A9W8MQC0_9AGAR|nr:hypothetical protein NLJ89_g8937 [Agrocybe chaxingu]